jgi:cytochrome bd ubiquinol oxidase subunit II
VATAWFIFLAVLVTVYVVLDGFDLGLGALHRVLPRSDEEREEAAAAIGPVWNGNEVWLLVSGGVLFMAFPKAYAGAFSGLYFGLIIVLWLLVGRGLALEMRHEIDHPLWRTACDTVFWLSSGALALVFGVALGNVVRGVPLQADGYFHLSLFGILNWYGLLVGVFALAVLCTHGATFLALRASPELSLRAGRAAQVMTIAVAVLFVVMIGPTYAVRDEMLTNLVDHPWRLVFPILAVAALVAMFVYQARGIWGRAFAASSLFLVGLLTTMAAGLYPNILPAHDGDPYSLTVHNAAAGSHTLKVALFWWPLGMVLAAVYSVLTYRMFFASHEAPSVSEN